MSAPELGKASIRAMNATKIESPEALATTQVLTNEMERFIEEVRHGRSAKRNEDKRKQQHSTLGHTSPEIILKGWISTQYG